MVDKKRLVKLYKKGWLSDEELAEYSELRKSEYLERKSELLAAGATNVKVVKGSDDDIVGCTWEDTLPAKA